MVAVVGVVVGVVGVVGVAVVVVLEPLLVLAIGILLTRDAPNRCNPEVLEPWQLLRLQLFEVGQTGPMRPSDMGRPIPCPWHS